MVRAGRVLSPEQDPLVEPDDERPQHRHEHSAPMVSRRRAFAAIILSVGLAAVAVIGVAQFRVGSPVSRAIGLKTRLPCVGVGVALSPIPILSRM